MVDPFGRSKGPAALRADRLAGTMKSGDTFQTGSTMTPVEGHGPWQSPLTGHWLGFLWNPLPPAQISPGQSIVDNTLCALPAIGDNSFLRCATGRSPKIQFHHRRYFYS